MISSDGGRPHGAVPPAPCRSGLLEGPRFIIGPSDAGFPEALKSIPRPPDKLHVIGDPSSLRSGIAIIGARKATPYGISCARRFARLAASMGLVVISGGAYGCDAAAHRGALEAGGCTVVFLGGGCDRLYPAVHRGLFQDVVNGGGAVVSEREWSHPPLPHTFRERNRLIAGLAKATLIVEAGLPSGTFSTADEALAAGREVLVVPGAVTSATSRGANRLICQGATPIIDDETFGDVARGIFDLENTGGRGGLKEAEASDPVLRALLAEPLRIEEIVSLDLPMERGGDKAVFVRTRLAFLEAEGVIVRYPDGRYGPAEI